jgi:hypothetical protein
MAPGCGLSLRRRGGPRHGLFPFPHVLRTPLVPERVRKLGAISTRLRFERRRFWSSFQRLFWGRSKNYPHRGTASGR